MRVGILAIFIAIVMFINITKAVILLIAAGMISGYQFLYSNLLVVAGYCSSTWYS